MRKPALLAFVIVCCVEVASPQSLFIPRNIQSAFLNGTRAASGMPGPKYWQNRGDYSIKVSFDPSTLLIRGEETITYYNNSPDALNRMVIHLFPDYYKRNMDRNYGVDEKDENEGVAIESLHIDGVDYGETSGRTRHDKTNLILQLLQPIATNTQVTIKVEWHYRLNSGSQNRTGLIDPSSFFIAYFFPRVAVYDDLDGWDEWSYSGVQEFYNDFGNFDVSISVPRNFTVWATGELMNEPEVIAPSILQKLEQAKQSRQIVHVIDSDSYKAGLVTADHAINTWKFQAENVTDFAFATSNHYLWDACSVVADKSSGRTVLVQSAFNKSHEDYFKVSSIARQCMELMRDSFPAYPFPFPQITIVDGTDQMEYPMMVNDNPTSSWAEAVQLVSHEMSHAYFPFYMGNNETEYAWMDEGWATLAESMISPLMDAPEEEGIFRKSKYEEVAGTELEVPLITNSELITGETYYCNSYGKAGLCYWVLKDLLGNEKFFKALHEFMNRWNGKHPMPYDFFNTINQVSEQNLDWFWKAWFFDYGYPDLAIKEVKVEKGKLKIIVERLGSVPVPIDLKVKLSDGTEINQHETAARWSDGGNFLLFQTNVNAPVQSVILGNEFTPDVNRANNIWQK